MRTYGAPSADLSRFRDTAPAFNDFSTTWPVELSVNASVEETPMPMPPQTPHHDDSFASPSEPSAYRARTGEFANVAAVDEGVGTGGLSSALQIPPLSRQDGTGSEAISTNSSVIQNVQYQAEQPAQSPLPAEDGPRTIQQAWIDGIETIFRPSIKRNLVAAEFCAVARLITRNDPVSLFVNSDKCQSVIRAWISLSDVMSACQQDELDRNQEVLNAFDEIVNWKRGPQDNKDRLRLRFVYMCDSSQPWNPSANLSQRGVVWTVPKDRAGVGRIVFPLTSIAPRDGCPKIARCA